MPVAPGARQPDVDPTLHRRWHEYRSALAVESLRPGAAAERGLSLLVQKARTAGVPWPVIGAGLGLSGTDAQLRYPT